MLLICFSADVVCCCLFHIFIWNSYGYLLYVLRRTLPCLFFIYLFLPLFLLLIPPLGLYRRLLPGCARGGEDGERAFSGAGL